MFADLVEELIVADDDVLVERLRASESEVRRLCAEQAAMLREVERRGLFCDDGHRSVKGFVKANLNWSNSQTAIASRTAALLDTVSGTGDALLAGHIGTAQAAELARLRANPRVGDRMAESIGVLLDAAEQLKYEDFRIVTLRWEALADIDGAEQREASRVEHRDVTALDTGDGLFLRGSGGSASAVAEMIAVFGSFIEHEFRVDCAARDDEHGPNAPASLLPRTDRQRRFDALQQMFRAADAARDAGIVVGPVPTVVNIIVSRFDLEHGLARFGLIPTPSDLTAPPLPVRWKETSSGSPIGDAEVVRAAIHGRVRTVVMDHTGMVVDYGRTRRLFTGPIREMAKLLGHRCAHPGCDTPAARCEVDHVVEYSNDGRSALDNAGLECSSHNRHKHRSKLRRQRVGPDQVVTTRADGTEMRPVGQRSPREKRRAERAGRPTMHPDALVAIRECFATRTDTVLNAWPTVNLTLVDGHYRPTG